MNDIKLFILTGENEDDVRHSLESEGARELVLRIALSTAHDWLVLRLKQWQTHQIELDQWCQLGDTTPELHAFRLELAWVYMVPPWLFYALIRRVELGKFMTFTAFSGYDVKDDVVPGGRRFLYDTWARSWSREANLPPVVEQFLAGVRQQNLFGMPFSAGALLSRCLEIANDMVGGAEMLAGELDPQYDRKEFQSV